MRAFILSSALSLCSADNHFACTSTDRQNGQFGALLILGVFTFASYAMSRTVRTSADEGRCSLKNLSLCVTVASVGVAAGLICKIMTEQQPSYFTCTA